VSTMFSKLALGETWAHTKHYFDWRLASRSGFLKSDEPS
jgi:hypothetical protein